MILSFRNIFKPTRGGLSTAAASCFSSSYHSSAFYQANVEDYNEKAIENSNSDGSLLWEVRDNIGNIVLNRPKQLNAVSVPMVESVSSLLSTWNSISKSGRKEDDIKCLLMYGNGGKAFCAGGDVVSLVKTIQSNPQKTLGQPGNLTADFFKKEYIMNHAIFTQGLLANDDYVPSPSLSSPASTSPALLAKEDMKYVPQISLWDGFVMGGGVGLSMGSKYKIVTEKTVFAMPETGIGLFPDVGGSYWLGRMKNGLGHYIGLTGCRLKASDLLYSGMATHYVPSEKLPQLISLLHEQCGKEKNAKLKIDNIITSVINEYEVSPTIYKEMKDTSTLNKYRDIIKYIFEDKNSVEEMVNSHKDLLAKDEIQNDIESDENLSKFLKTISKAFANSSPTSMKVSHKAIALGGTMSLEEVFLMEYRLSQRCMLPDGDFSEGVRALLIDKDGKPQWKPKTIEEVTSADVDFFFNPLEEESFELKL